MENLISTSPRFKLKALHNPLRNIIFHFSLLGSALIIGSFLKLFHKMSKSRTSTSSWITGIPLMRTYYFLLPILLTTFTVIFTIKHFYNKKHHDIKHSYNIWKFLYKLKLTYAVTNVFLLVFFYFMYGTLYIPLWNYNTYRLSGHTLAAMFSGVILANICCVCESFISLNISRKGYSYIRYVAIALLYHNAYSVIWTAWIFHKASECFVSFFLSAFFGLVIEGLNLDRTLINILSPQLPKAKEKNMIIN